MRDKKLTGKVIKAQYDSGFFQMEEINGPDEFCDCQLSGYCLNANSTLCPGSLYECDVEKMYKHKEEQK